MRVGPVSVAWAEARSPAVRLSAVDQARAAAYPAQRRARFTTGRALLAELVAERFPGAVGWEVTTGPCPRCGGLHGAVTLSGLPALASLSYADAMVVAAVASLDDLSRLGVDAERDDPEVARSADLAGLLGCDPQVSLHRWTQVEAVVKADGRGLLLDPAAVNFDAGSAWIDDDPTPYCVADVSGPAGYLVTLAWR